MWMTSSYLIRTPPIPPKPTMKNPHFGRSIYVFPKYSIFPLPLRDFFFTLDPLAGQPAGWTAIEIITLLIIYLPGREALLRQLIKSVKDL